MNLNQFKEVANERTRYIVMTPQLYTRIIDAVRLTSSKRRRVPLLVAAACLAIMALSGGIFAMENMGWFVGYPARESTDFFATDSKSQDKAAAVISAATDSNAPRMTVLLSPTVQETDIVPKMDEKTDLWGYVDGNGKWVIDAEYVRADPVKGLTGKVLTKQGEEILIILQK